MFLNYGVRRGKFLTPVLTRLPADEAELSAATAHDMATLRPVSGPSHE
jgi:hypothetical protein